MSESFEKHHIPDGGMGALRAAVLTVLLGLVPASAKAEIPECHDIGSRPQPAASVYLHGGEEATVKCVVDGDTFDVTLTDGRTLRVRLWGVDCPESRANAKCQKKGASSCESEIKRGKKAKELTKQLLSGKKVILRGPFSNNGERKLSYVFVKDKDLGLILIGTCQCEEGYRHKEKDRYEKEAENKCGR